MSNLSLRIQPGGRPVQVSGGFDAVALFGSDLAAWFEIDEGVTVDSGKVDLWADKSTNGYDLSSYLTTINRPDYVADWNNGFGAIRTANTGGSYGMKNTSVPSSSQPFAMFVVGATEGSVGNEDIVVASNFATANQRASLTTYTSSDRISTVTDTGVTDGGDPSGDAHIIGGIFNGSSSYTRVDGVNGTTGNHNSDTYGGELWLAQSQAGTTRCAFNYQAVLVVHALPTAAQIAALEAFWGAKYAISL